MRSTWVGPLDGPDDIPAPCHFCNRPGVLYVDFDPDANQVIIPYCKKCADRLFVKLGKLLGYVD